jgi:hypothetical protein
MTLRAPLQNLRLASLIAVLNLAACGDSGTASETTGPTTGTPSTGEPVTETAAITTGSSTTSEPTTGGGQTESGSSSGGTTSTGEPGTTSGTSTSPGTGTSDSSSGEPDSSSGSTGDSGGELMACKTDADCTLVDDCCACEPIGPGEMLPACDKQCIINTCAGHGLENAPLECRFGRCTFAKIACNPLGVNCNAPKPDCAPGQVPSVLENDDGKCWTGACVPAEACDWVPDCTYCNEDELVCVGKLQKGAYHLCEPKPIDCGDDDDIDCGCGQQICDASPPHTVCHDATPDIDCECPFC